jgi:hypothetical protein
MSGQPDAGDQNGRCRDRGSRPDPGSPGSDIWNDVQRWFIRSSAKSMRREIGGQVRKSFGGGRTDNSDAWNTATTEVPSAEGEAPECQWCPICRAARHMRESNPGLSGQLTGAGDVVASAVQDAIKAFDSLLSRTAGYTGGSRDAGPGDSRPSGAGSRGAGSGGAGPGDARPSGAGSRGAGPGDAGSRGAGQPESHKQDEGPDRGAPTGADGREDGREGGPGDRG